MAGGVPGVDRRSAPFWRGLLVGAGAVAAALAMGLGYLATAGVTVTVTGDLLVARMGEEVEAAVRRELSGVLRQAQAEWPQRVQEAARSQIAAVRVEVAGLSLELPEAARTQVERAVAEAAQAAVESVAGNLPVDELAERIGARAAALARERLPQVLAEQRIVVEAAPWLRVPVRLQVR